MTIGRRELVAGAAAVAAVGVVGGPRAVAAMRTSAARTGAPDMYGLIGKVIAAPGRRDELVAILLEGVAGMPGCLSYVVARDPADADAIWITEVWDAKASHGASLALPAVKDAITKGRPLIAGFGDRVVTTPVGGHGLARR